MWTRVEVINGAPEPDGSYKHCFLEVPPYIATAGEDVARTYRFWSRKHDRVMIRTGDLSRGAHPVEPGRQVRDQIFGVLETDMKPECGAWFAPACCASVGRWVERNDKAFEAAP